MIHGQLHRRFDVRLVAHVGLDEYSLATQGFQFSDNGFSADHVQFGNHHGSAFFGKIQRNPAPNAASGASDQRNLLV
ncbi:hypothetical protein D9M71_588150 [compost metagenome]